jgi:DtxR family transcriptional regulator, Mn-dependent transcriptional regulator
MTSPLFSLTVVTAALALAVVLFWPARGLFWRGLRLLKSNERVLIEDALKHAYDCEYRQTPCTLHSLAGALSLSGARATALIARLEGLGLIEESGGAYRLSVNGRSDALRVVRIHRLWERYLSDETGLDPTEWHAEADAREHSTSPQEAESLAVKMGEPRYDPHGDPIPTADGEIAPRRGKPLSELEAGEEAEIVHVEDEPASVYAQLVAEGLYPGMRVRMLEKTPTRVRFEGGAEEHVLAPVLAANLTVIAHEGEVRSDAGLRNLSALALGEAARVTGISALCRGLERRRLLDLGVVPGTSIEAEFTSPSGDPTAYRVRGALVALRREQADLIHVDGASPAAGDLR